MYIVGTASVMMSHLVAVASVYHDPGLLYANIIYWVTPSKEYTRDPFTRPVEIRDPAPNSFLPLLIMNLSTIITRGGGADGRILRDHCEVLINID